MKNFQIGKEINRLLTEGNALNVTGKIFPLVANPNTSFPFLVYRRLSYRPANTKDGIGEIIIIEVNIASETYNEGVDIANSVADILCSAHSQLIQRVQLINVSELFLQDTFIQNIQFQIELQD